MSIKEEREEQAADHNRRLKKFRDMAKQSDLTKNLKEASHREFASVHKMHPDMAKHMEVGQEHDYYEPGTGDKVSGKVMHKNATEVHMKQTHDSYDPKKKGTVHKFKIANKLDEDIFVEGKDKEMVMIDLQTIINHVNRLEKCIGKEMDLPEWVESKITLAADYIGCVADYIEADLQVNEEEKKKKPKWLIDAEERAEAKEGKLKESDMKSFKDFVGVLKEYESDKNGVYRHTKKASYGTSYSDPEGEFESKDDMKKATKKAAGRKTGQSVGSYKRRQPKNDK
jgi:hypothetical protein